MPKTAYDRQFYQRITGGARGSAREVVPTLIDLLAPRSVVDVGCGTGAWLSVFRDHAVEDVLGIDGDYVDPESLQIPSNAFLPADLRRPIHVGRTFDMALSVEVAEHIPAESASIYLDSLTRLSDAIVFSAAIPNQGGTGHVNEQWPEYWKDRFETRGYVLIDCLRHRIWNNRNVERWYRQNMVLYVTEQQLERDEALQREYAQAKGRPLSIIHPATYAAPSFGTLVRMMPTVLTRAVRRRFGGAS